MKNIFMLVNYSPNDRTIGITKKICGQIKALKSLGYVVYYSCYTENGVAVCNDCDEIIESITFNFYSKTFSQILRFDLLLKNVFKFITFTDLKFDFCYGRISAPTRNYLNVLEAFHRIGAKVIIEALSYFPGVKPMTMKSRFIWFFINKNKADLKIYIDKIITEGTVNDFFGIPSEKGLIGIDMDSLPKYQYLGDKNELNLISVANEREYHGYDRLIKSLKAHIKKGSDLKVIIHFVGNLKYRTKLLVDESIAHNIVMYGRLYGEKLYEVYNNCNLGVGPLGQHRIGGKKDTGLKTKEYLGLGLPYIYSGKEEDLPEDFPYIYQVNADESMLDFDNIWKFYCTIKEDPFYSNKIRGIASKVFSWDNIMKKALEI